MTGKGRPTEYNEEIIAEICAEISSGRSLRAICQDDGMPAAATVFKWLARYPDFVEQYSRAREAQADALFDEIQHIADNPMIGEKTKVTSDGKTETTTGDMIEHRRLRVDARKWMAGKLRPKKYGDKLDLNVAGSLQTMPEEDIDARITQLLGKAGVGAAAGGAGSSEGEE